MRYDLSSFSASCIYCISVKHFILASTILDKGCVHIRVELRHGDARLAYGLQATWPARLESVQCYISAPPRLERRREEAEKM